MTTQKQLVIVSAGTSDPSSTRLLADRVAQRIATLGVQKQLTVGIRTIELRELAGEIANALVSNHIGPKLQKAIDALQHADGIVASTPVYKAGASGLFTSFFQILDNDLLIAKPVVLAATEDWTDPGLNKRIDRAALELVALMASAFEKTVRDESWGRYQHEFGSAGGTELSIDLDSDLMKLAAGGQA
jgi:FMN reductase